MSDIKRNGQNLGKNKKSCQNSNCRCPANYLLIGVFIILITLFIATTL